MSEGLPRMYCRFAQREILNAPTGWAAGVTAPNQGLFPELIPLVYLLRSPGAAKILRSPAMLYILLRDCRTHKRSETTCSAWWRVTALLTRPAGMPWISRRRCAWVTASTSSSACPLTGLPPATSAKLFRDPVGMSDAEYAALRRPARIPRPQSAFNGYFRRFATAGARNPVQLRPYPLLSSDVSLVSRGDRLAHADQVITALVANTYSVRGSSS